MQAACLADDLPIDYASMQHWTEAQVTAYFESGGVNAPARCEAVPTGTYAEIAAKAPSLKVEYAAACASATPATELPVPRGPSFAFPEGAKVIFTDHRGATLTGTVVRALTDSLLSISINGVEHTVSREKLTLVPVSPSGSHSAATLPPRPAAKATIPAPEGIASTIPEAKLTKYLKVFQARTTASVIQRQPFLSLLADTKLPLSQEDINRIWALADVDADGGAPPSPRCGYPRAPPPAVIRCSTSHILLFASSPLLPREERINAARGNT